MHPLALSAQTLLFSASLLGFLAAALTFTLARTSGRARQAVIAWGQGMLCVGITLLSAFLRGHLPDYSFLVFGNASIMAFGLLALHAYARLFGLRYPARAILSLYLVQCCSIIAFYVTGVSRDYAVVTLCSLLTVELLLAAALILRHGVRVANPARWVAAAMMALLATLFAVRAALAFSGEAPIIDAAAQSRVQIVTLIATSIGIIGSTIAFVMMVQDCSHRDALEGVRRDTLTGVLTRRAFFEELSTLEQQRGEAYALVMLDVDHFKSFNDRYGHAGGDAVLACVGALLRRSTRSSDVVGRYGGEEFCVLLRGCGDAEAKHFSERLVAEAAREVVRMSNGEDARFTLSAGYADETIVQTGEVGVRPVRRVLERADSALYAAKRAGRNRATGAADDSFFSTSLATTLSENVIAV